MASCLTLPMARPNQHALMGVCNHSCGLVLNQGNALQRHMALAKHRNHLNNKREGLSGTANTGMAVEVFNWKFSTSPACEPVLKLERDTVRLPKFWKPFYTSFVEFMAAQWQFWTIKQVWKFRKRLTFLYVAHVFLFLLCFVQRPSSQT